jgi:alanine-glyoxylate transaminase/serine-glyoxylate transaminase/serine-pyruvate transaminase
MVDARVLSAMATPLVGHLDPSFLEIMDRTQELLRYVFQTNNQLTVAISGTGSAAMEAAIANLVEPGDQVLVCAAGYFGLRMAEMAKRYGGQVQVIQKPWGEVFSHGEVQAALQAQPARIVTIVHAETSTGVLQPLDEMIKIVHAQGGIIIVDAVTSLGGIPVNVDERDIDVCYSGTQKCLGCPPGLGPITLGWRALEKLRKRTSKIANWYLDLSLLEKYWGTERLYHHTAPISLVFALYKALGIVQEEGLEQRYIRHRQNAELFWAGLEELSLHCHVPQDYRLPTLTTIDIPEGVDEAAVRLRLLQDYNIEIAGGLGELKGKVWRVGLMGFSSRPENVLLLLGALQRILKS